jgi:bisphosphoglycerate-independent phosphoglycerate mutase (AlkP superfamily)
MMKKKTHMLIILDGWGIGADEPTNAVLAADTPFLDRLQSSLSVDTVALLGPGCGTARRNHGQQ